LRVSTDDQTVTAQRHSLKNWLTLNGKDEDVKWYKDEGFTGSNQDRPAFQRLMKEVQPGDTVVCFAVDRMTREGIAPALQLWKSLKAKGVKLVSVSEPWLDDNNPCADLILSVLSWAAEQERKRIRYRQREGINAAREANGGVCPWGGREAGKRNKATLPKIDVVRQLHEQGKPIAEIARVVGWQGRRDR
jgi:DNA invertase Pin-like site-specific DNA recombinase